MANDSGIVMSRHKAILVNIWRAAWYRWGYCCTYKAVFWRIHRVFEKCGKSGVIAAVLYKQDVIETTAEKYYRYKYYAGIIWLGFRTIGRIIFIIQFHFRLSNIIYIYNIEHPVHYEYTHSYTTLQDRYIIAQLFNFYIHTMCNIIYRNIHDGYEQSWCVYNIYVHIHAISKCIS